MKSKKQKQKTKNQKIKEQDKNEYIKKNMEFFMER